MAKFRGVEDYNSVEDYVRARVANSENGWLGLNFDRENSVDWRVELALANCTPQIDATQKALTHLEGLLEEHKATLRATIAKGWQALLEHTTIMGSKQLEAVEAQLIMPANVTVTECEQVLETKDFEWITIKLPELRNWEKSATAKSKEIKYSLDIFKRRIRDRERASMTVEERNAQEAADLHKEFGTFVETNQKMQDGYIRKMPIVFTPENMALLRREVSTKEFEKLLDRVTLFATVLHTFCGKVGIEFMKAEEGLKTAESEVLATKFQYEEKQTDLPDLPSDLQDVVERNPYQHRSAAYRKLNELQARVTHYEENWDEDAATVDDNYNFMELSLELSQAQLRMLPTLQRRILKAHSAETFLVAPDPPAATQHLPRNYADLAAEEGGGAAGAAGGGGRRVAVRGELAGQGENPAAMNPRNALVAEDMLNKDMDEMSEAAKQLLYEEVDEVPY